MGKIGLEVLGSLVGVWHWYHWRDQRPKLAFEVEQNESAAYVAPDEGNVYYSAAFYGGRRQNVTELWEFMTDAAYADISQDIIPVYHDESYMNRYFIDHPPDVVLTPSYYCGEHGYCGWPYELKMVYINKNYTVVRGN